MTEAQIEYHNNRGRKENLTPERLERKNAKSRKINLTSEQLEAKRSLNRISNMSDAQAQYTREKSRIRMKRKRELDPTFRISGYVSRLINFMLKSKGSSKVGESFSKYVPWGRAELKTHVEKQFEPWMTWNNHGKYDSITWDDTDQTTWTWQLDHIIPRSDLPYASMTDDNFKKCWALENLRPYSAKQNIIDGTSRTRHSNKGKN
ncbi:MAG: hypothetical protein ACREBJ_11775 [Nitrosotalea sp.]